jgi:hypothetical protein
LQSAKGVGYDILRPFHLQVARRVNSWWEFEHQKLLTEEWVWFVRCAIMELSKSIFQFMYAITELFDLGMEFSGVRENEAVKAGQKVSSGSTFPEFIRARQSKKTRDVLNVYFRAPDDVPVAPMTNKSPIWTDGTAA